MGMVVHYQSLRANRSLRFVRQLRLAHFLFGEILVRLIKCKIKFLIKIEEVCYNRRMGICCSDWFSFGLSLGQTTLLKEVM